MSEIIFLSVEQVCAIQSSTLPGVPSSDIGRVEGAVDRILNQYHYNGISDIFLLAAFYLVALATAHAFPDANKRTAFQSASIFLELNNIFINSNEELIETTVNAATGIISIEDIAQIFRNNSQ